MKYWLTTLGLISAIDDSILASFLKPSNDRSFPTEPFETPATPSSYVYLKPEEIDYHCLHRILSALSDNLYDIYFEYKSAKELWTALTDEYSLDDAGIERFTSSSFNKFMITDTKPINEQLHEFQDFIRHLQSKGNQFSEDYKVSCLIDKLPPSWLFVASDLRQKVNNFFLQFCFDLLSA